MSDLGLKSTNPRKKKCSIHFICYVLKKIYSKFRISKKKGKERKRKLALTTMRKKKNSNFEFQKKKNCRIYFLILSSWAEIEPSHQAIELRSRAKTISKSKPLSYWAVIRGIEPWSEQAKPRSKSLSQKSKSLSWDMSQAELSHVLSFILLPNSRFY